MMSFLEEKERNFHSLGNTICLRKGLKFQVIIRQPGKESFYSVNNEGRSICYVKCKINRAPSFEK